MLARTAITTTSSLARASAKRNLSASATATKSFQHVVATSPSSAGIQSPPPLATTAATVATSTSISSGELAWCEIYGVDYEQQLQEALDESPLAVNEAHRFAASPSIARNSNSDIWNVVFGSASA